jgi:hypothetical protein
MLLWRQIEEHMATDVINLSCVRFNRILSKQTCYEQVCDLLDKAIDEHKVRLSDSSACFILNALMKVLFRRFTSRRALFFRLLKTILRKSKYDQQQAVLDKLNNKNHEAVCRAFLTEIKKEEYSDVDQQAQMAFKIAMDILRYYFQHEDDIYAEAWSAIHVEFDLLCKAHSILRKH